MTQSKNPIFCAIDTTDIALATRMAAQVSDYVGGLKLGLEFFCANGPEGVLEVSKASGKDIFLDLKLFDIPNTVAAAVKAVMPLKPRYLTLHTSGGRDMMLAARKAVDEVTSEIAIAPPKLIGVTVLTSFDQSDLTDVGVTTDLTDQAKRLTDLAAEVGLDGIVCSAHEAAILRQENGQLLRIVPGIRPPWHEAGDQKRIMGPKEALEQGADILVIGRPITHAASPSDAAFRLASDIGLSDTPYRA